MARRGRSRKSGVRKPNGILRWQDRGAGPSAVELRRLAILELSGAEREQCASYPLGVIWKRRLICSVEHLAGLEFAKLHRWVEGALAPPKPPGSCLAQMLPSGEGVIATVGDGPSATTTELYLKARDAIRDAGSRAWSQIQNIVIYEHWPGFLDTARARPLAAWDADKRDLAALHQGLGAIVAILKLRGDPKDQSSELEDSVASFRLRRASRAGAPLQAGMTL